MRFDAFRRPVLLVAVAASTLLVGSLLAGCEEETSESGFDVLMTASPGSLDPRFATSDASAKLVGLIHAGLVTVETKSGNPELELATSIEQPEPTVYEVELREGLEFHDGEPLTSSDVEYTLTRLDSETVESPYAATARLIEAFEIEDERHFRIELEEPHAPFRTELSMGIVPEHRCAGHSECPGEPVGAGPFEFVERQGDRRFVLAGFDRYFEGAPAIERLDIRVVENENARLLSLLGKNAELVQNGVKPTMLPVVRDAEGLSIQTAESFKYTYIGFNLEHDILGDRRVRRAIAYGIDRESIVENKFHGHATLSSGLLAPFHWAYEPDVDRYGYRPDKARRLLDRAGYPDPGGEQPRFEVEFKVSAKKFRKSIAELIAHQLKRIGIRVDVRSYEWGTFFHDIKSRNFAMATLQWVPGPEPSIYRWIFHSENIPTAENRAAGANRGAYRNSELDELLERGERVTDRERRKEIYSEVQKILARDVPYVSLWHEHNIAILREGVRGYYITPNARFEALGVARPPED